MWSESFLQVKMIVWGKIESYPWWPGKIVQIIEQDNLLVYKVSFFGDASYSYLHQQNIIPYQFFDINLNNSFLIDSKLEKAIEHAKRIAEKKQLSFRSTDEEISSSRQQITLNPHSHEPTPEAHHAQPLHMQDNYPNNSANEEVVFSDIMKNAITIDNVIDLIKISTTFVRNQGYCYSNRKQIIKFKNDLQVKLLDKYNLSNFNCKECTQTQKILISTSFIHKIQPKKLKKNIYKHRHPKNNQQIRLLMIKKLQKKIVEQGKNHSLSKQKSISIYNDLMVNFGGYTSQLKQRYINMIRENDLSCFYQQKQQI